MAEAVNSILLVDCDSLRRSLLAAGYEHAASQLSTRVGEWMAALETGELIGPVDTPRRLELKRCYAGAASAKHSGAFTDNGFEIVELGTDGSADLRLAVDAMDALTVADPESEFIILSATADLMPLVSRLRSGDHHVAIYADDHTTAASREAASAVLTAEEFASFLSDQPALSLDEEEDAEVAMPESAAAPVGPVDKSLIEGFAREIHSATNIPLFSPRTFAELFRSLAEEVATRGYHFQETAKNVADNLTAAGRPVNSRQVTFVVKGLALKGHVFSNGDAPERLAEVFREQARYLIGNAGIEMDAEREALLDAWIGAARATAPAQAPAEPIKPAPVTRPTSGKTEKPAAQKAPPPKPPTRPKSTALPPKPGGVPAKVEVKPPSAAELRASIAARITAAAHRRPLRPPPKPAPPPAVEPPPPPKVENPLETSILAAIAEAVDVLVDDRGGEEVAEAVPPDTAPQRPRRAARPNEDQGRKEAPRKAVPEPPAEDDRDGGGDIGDEIQRIVASYSRNRKEEPGG